MKRSGQTERRCRVWVLVLSLGILAGCVPAKQGGVDSVVLSLSQSGTVSMNGRIVDANRLSRHLEAAGAGRRTSIRIEVPDGISPARLREVSSRLNSAGYSRIFFMKPKHATAEVKGME